MTIVHFLVKDFIFLLNTGEAHSSKNYSNKCILYIYIYSIFLDFRPIERVDFQIAI